MHCVYFRRQEPSTGAWRSWGSRGLMRMRTTPPQLSYDRTESAVCPNRIIPLDICLSLYLCAADNTPHCVPITRLPAHHLPGQLPSRISPLPACPLYPHVPPTSLAALETLTPSLITPQLRHCTRSNLLPRVEHVVAQMGRVGHWSECNQRFFNICQAPTIAAKSPRRASSARQPRACYGTMGPQEVRDGECECTLCHLCAVTVAHAGAGIISQFGNTWYAALPMFSYGRTDCQIALTDVF